MKTLLFILSAVSFTLSGSVCYAEQAFRTGSLPPTPEARASQAREWLEGFKRLDRQIPTLSLAERARLKAEYDDQLASTGGTYTARAVAALKSTEYNKRRAREGLEEILVDLLWLSRPNILVKQDEIVAWTRLADSLADVTFWQSVSVLFERRLLSGDVNGYKAFLLENHVEAARGILSRIVIPMIRAGTRPR